MMIKILRFIGAEVETPEEGIVIIDGKNVNIEAEMVQAMEELYAKHMPVRVREYISKKNLSDPNKSSSNGNRK